MKYLVTSVMTSPDKRKHFDPTFDTELFDSYISALRWCAGEKHQAVRLGCRVYNETPSYRSDYGRQEMFNLCFDLNGNFYRLTISRINENGFH